MSRKSLVFAGNKSRYGNRGRQEWDVVPSADPYDDGHGLADDVDAILANGRGVSDYDSLSFREPAAPIGAKSRRGEYDVVDDEFQDEFSDDDVDDQQLTIGAYHNRGHIERTRGDFRRGARGARGSRGVRGARGARRGRRGEYEDVYRARRYPELEEEIPRGRRRALPRRGMSYSGRRAELVGAAVASESAIANNQHYYDEHDKPVAIDIGRGIVDGDPPVAYRTICLPFKKTTTLAQAAADGSHEIDIPLNFGKSPLLRQIAASGALLGHVAVKNLRQNGPADLAFRAEYKPSGGLVPAVSLRAPTRFLESASNAVHVVVPQQARDGRGVDLQLRDVQPASNTFLSDPKYAGVWTAENIHEGINPIANTSQVSIPADHPVSDSLYQRGLISEKDLLEGNIAVVGEELVTETLGELKAQERANSLFKDAENIRLVAHRAFGKDRLNIGKPAMTDTSELVALSSLPAANRAAATKRLMAKPFVIEGEWELSFGHPAEIDAIAAGVDDDHDERHLEEDLAGEEAMLREEEEEAHRQQRQQEEAEHRRQQQQQEDYIRQDARAVHAYEEEEL